MRFFKIFRKIFEKPKKSQNSINTVKSKSLASVVPPRWRFSRLPLNQFNLKLIWTRFSPRTYTKPICLRIYLICGLFKPTLLYSFFWLVDSLWLILLPKCQCRSTNQISAFCLGHKFSLQILTQSFRAENFDIFFPHYPLCQIRLEIQK